MTTETKPELSLLEKADILRENGVSVIQCLNPETSRYFPLLTITFEGDEDEGHRALRIMQEHGVYVWEFQRWWHYEGCEELTDERWALLFAPAT